jgi:Bacterial membrane protein YfhO
MKREEVWAAAILITVLHLCFFSCIWGNKTFLESSRDQPSIMPQGAWAGKPLAMPFAKMLDNAAAWHTEPLLALIAKDYVNERSLPLWNPYQAYGSPLAADMQSQPFYPLSIALSLHLTPRTYSWFVLLRLFLAGFCAYLYIRLFVSFIPALGAGVTSMLAGYYILFITMPQLSVEVLLPAALLAGEHLLRRARYWSVVWFSAVIFLVIVGGMPESSLLLLSFLYLYLAFRLLLDRPLRLRWLHRTAYVLVATVSGLALSALLLLPFGEYMMIAFDAHQPSNIGGAIKGLVHDPRDLSIFTYVYPLLYGPPFSSTLSPGWNGLRDYAGIISLFLILIALLGSSWRRERHERRLSSLTWFFSFCVVAVIFKRYGFPPFNFLGSLPFFNLVQFPKYDELILSICVSMLCAIGIERMSRCEIPVWAQSTALGGAFLTLPLALIFSFQTLSKEILVNHLPLGFPLWTIALPVCLLFCVALLLIAFRQKLEAKSLPLRIVTPVLAITMLVLLTGERTLNYVAPVYHSFGSRLPTRADNAYLGAPFIHYLRAQSGQYRIFGQDNILFPNWASAFGLFDIRDLDAMYYSRYFVFLHNFFPQKLRSYGEELGDRFTGAADLDLTDFLQRRLLQLSSVQYFIAMKPVTEPNSIVAEILSQNERRITLGKENLISHQHFILDSVAREALGEHPPYDRLPYSLLVDREHEDLRFSYALHPSVFENTCGDGVEFILEVKDASGKITKLFSSYIDPKHTVTERHWIDGSVDLSPYRGQRIHFLLSTNGGPKGDTCNDWAAWSNFHDGNAWKDGRTPFKLVYDQEVKIYRYVDVLPRASIYYNAIVKKNEEGVLRELADPNLNIFQSVVLDGSKLEGHQLAAVEDMDAVLPSRMKAAKIISYDSRVVTVEAALERSGVLVLNDSNYPGWEVDVDGHKGKMLDANYLFRGVYLAPGRHTVRFTYNPQSFRIGVAFSVASVTFLTGWGIVEWWNRRRGSFTRSK